MFSFLPELVNSNPCSSTEASHHNYSSRCIIHSVWFDNVIISSEEPSELIPNLLDYSLGITEGFIMLLLQLGLNIRHANGTPSARMIRMESVWSGSVLW